DVGGVTIPIVFVTGEVHDGTDPFVAFSASGAIKLGDFIEIRGTFSSDPGETTFSDVVVFVGQGPAFDDTGELNSTARGIAITGANGRIYRDGGDIKAFSATGTVQILGVPG